MKLSIGNNPEAPQLEAQISRRDVRILLQRPGFAELRTSFGSEHATNDIRLTTTDGVESYSLLADTMNCWPIRSHEVRLRPFVRLLEWGCLIDHSLPNLETASPTDSFVLNEITTERSFNGLFSLRSIVKWPELPSKQVGEIVTTVMQSFGKQIQYGSYANAQQYDNEVGADYHRKEINHIGATMPDKVILRTDERCLVQPVSRFRSNISASHFEFEEIRLGSHKEQLVSLVGALAIGHADQLATS